MIELLRIYFIFIVITYSCPDGGLFCASLSRMNSTSLPKCFAAIHTWQMAIPMLIEEFIGNLAFGHDEAGEHEERDSKKNETVQPIHHAPDGRLYRIGKRWINQ
jgi:hypothetical protein